MADGLYIWQWAGLVLPTLALIGLFVRLGSILKSIRDLEQDMKVMAASIKEIGGLVVELRAWRDAYKAGHDDLLERVRRIEGAYLGYKEKI